MRHSNTSPKQQRRPLPYLLYKSFMPILARLSSLNLSCCRHFPIKPVVLQTLSSQTCHVAENFQSNLSCCRHFPVKLVLCTVDTFLSNLSCCTVDNFLSNLSCCRHFPVKPVMLQTLSCQTCHVVL